MDIMGLGAIGELVGGVAVIGSLIFVGLQVRGSNHLARAATELEATPACDPDVINKGQALLECKLADEPGSQQLVQATIFREGFETGQIISSDPLPPDQTTLRFTQVAGQALHRWRVLTRSCRRGCNGSSASCWRRTVTSAIRGPAT